MRISPVLLALVAGVLARAPSAQTCAGGDDAFEENDTCIDAVALPTGLTTGLNCENEATDPDYYSVVVGPFQRVTVEATFQHALGDIDLRLLSAGNCSQVLDASATVSDVETVSWINAGSIAVPLTVHAFVFGTADDCNDYALEVVVEDVPPPCVGGPDVFEDNDTCATAAPLLPGTYRDLNVEDPSTDPDHYRVSVAPGERLDVTLDFLHGLGNVDASLVDAADCATVLDTATSVTDGEELSFENLGGGAVDVVVVVWVAGALPRCNDYDLVVDLAPDPCAGDDGLEDSDDCASAVPIGVGRFDDLLVHHDDEDFYRVPVAERGTLFADIRFEHAGGDLDLYLFDALDPTCGSTVNATPLARSFSATDDEAVVWTNTTGVDVDVVVWVDWFPPFEEGCNRYDLLLALGEPGGLGGEVCAGEPNSTGLGARLTASGTLDVVADDLTLAVDRLPLDSFGYFVNSRDVGILAHPGGSEGTLCIDDGAVGRHNRSPAEILFSGPAGAVSLALDLDDVPTPTGATRIEPGETWYFQYWYRDSSGGSPTSNFSSARRLDFE